MGVYYSGRQYWEISPDAGVGMGVGPVSFDEETKAKRWLPPRYDLMARGYSIYCSLSVSLPQKGHWRPCWVSATLAGSLRQMLFFSNIMVIESTGNWVCAHFAIFNWLDPQQQTQVKFETKHKTFISVSMKCLLKWQLQNVAHFVQVPNMLATQASAAVKVDQIFNHIPLYLQPDRRLLLQNSFLVPGSTAMTLGIFFLCSVSWQLFHCDLELFNDFLPVYDLWNI